MKNAKLLCFANTSMLLSGLAFLSTTFIAYGLETVLPLLFIAIMHVSQLILAGFFKVSYVLRLVAQKQLGFEIS